MDDMNAMKAYEDRLMDTVLREKTALAKRIERYAALIVANRHPQETDDVIASMGGLSL